MRVYDFKLDLILEYRKIVYHIAVRQRVLRKCVTVNHGGRPRLYPNADHLQVLHYSAIYNHKFW